MQIFMQELIDNQYIELDESISFDDIEDSNIKKLSNVHVKGYVKYNILEQIELDLRVYGTMWLNDSITLKEIPYDFDFKIDEIITEDDDYYANFFKNNKNILDIKEILWENIVLEVPISFTKEENTTLKGNGWELNGDTKNIKGGE